MDHTRALQRAVREYGPGSDSLAAALYMSTTTLSHKSSPTYQSQFFSPEEAVHLQQITGKHYCLHSMAAALGYAVRQLPAVDVDGAAPCATALLATIKEFADFTQQVTTAAKACEAGKGHLSQIKPKDMAAVEREALEAVAAITQLVAWCRSRAAQEAL